MDLDSTAGFGQLLSRWLASELDDRADLRIDGLQRRSSGFSRENWVFDAVWTDDGGDSRRDELIARRDPVGSVLVTDRTAEFELLATLSRSDVPVPQVRWLDPDGRWLGRPTIIMTRETGYCDYFVLNGADPLEHRVALAQQFCDLLVSIHQVDWKAADLASLGPDPGAGAAGLALDHWEAELRRCQLEPLPEIEFVLRWLRARAPASERTVLVHGDFKPGNTLLDHPGGQGGRVRVVLDWETAHLGDPVEDLGWITNPVRRAEHQIPGAWEVDHILAYYQEATGLAVEPAELRWWNVFSNLKLLTISLTGLAALRDERYDRPLQMPGGLITAMLDLMEL